MKYTLRNIFNLSKIFIKENDNSLKIIDDKNKTINKKSVLFWAYVILFFGSFYISSKILDYTVAINKPEIFLNGILLFLQIVIISRTIMISINIFYHSKDIEAILHLPFKHTEILISKFNTILFMNYELELLLGIVPIYIYQIRVYEKAPSIINLIFALTIFPIFTTLISSIIIIILMKIVTKFIKNRDIMQKIIIFILLFILILGIYTIISYVFKNQDFLNAKDINEKIVDINSYFLNINPTAEVLQKKGFSTKLIYYIVLFVINSISFLAFIFIGKKIYLEQLLKAKFYYKNIKNKKINLNKECKKNRIAKSYIKKEFKLLTKNPLFFIRSIYPVITLTAIVSILLIVLTPILKKIIYLEEAKDFFETLRFNMEDVCIIIGIVQSIGLFNYTSITSFSREGKNASIIKTLPISLYKQFIYKNIPQIFINIICSIIIFLVINFQIQEIGIKYIFIMISLSIMLTIINSFILCLIDLLMPKLDWEGEYEILKNNKNKLLQYVLIIFNIIFFINVNNVLKNYNLDISLFALFLFVIIVFIVLNIYIYKLKDKLFYKIK